MQQKQNAEETYLLLHFIFDLSNQQLLTLLLANLKLLISDQQGHLDQFKITTFNPDYSKVMVIIDSLVDQKLQVLSGEHLTLLKRSTAYSTKLN